MRPVDEFDHVGEEATEAEICELLEFADARYEALAADIRHAIANGLDQYRYLYRVLVDDMRRIQAGRYPRYTPFRILPTDGLWCDGKLLLPQEPTC